MVRLRHAHSDDVHELAGLYLRARAAAAAAGTIPPPVHDEGDIRGWVADVVVARLDSWVAQHESDIVGMLVLDGDWLDQLYVDPVWTGQGIGARLIALAKQERPGGLRLWTFVANPGAQRFYRRHGFQELRRTDGAGNEEGAPDIEFAWAPAATA